jgi:hypothetical protein
MSCGKASLRNQKIIKHTKDGELKYFGTVLVLGSVSKRFTYTMRPVFDVSFVLM